MVKYYVHSLDRIFMALSDTTRRAILTRLATGDATVSELTEPFDMSMPAITKHLTILENAGLIARQKKGRLRLCKLDAGPLQNAAEWLVKYRHFWEGQFDALDEYLHQTNLKERTYGKSDE